MNHTTVPSPRCCCGHCAGPEALTLTAARLAVALTDTVGRFVQASDQNLGHVETQVAQQAQEHGQFMKRIGSWVGGPGGSGGRSDDVRRSWR